MFNRIRSHLTRGGVRWYDKKVVEHFNNPKNVGKFDKNDPNVGTGLVGAPACFHGDTKVITESGIKTLKEIYEVNSILTVMSFNLKTKEFEYKNARALKLEPQNMDILSFNENTSDQGSIVCTPDHKFLLNETFFYIDNKYINSEMGIVPFKRRVKEDDSVSFCNGYKKYSQNITSRKYSGEYDCYTLQVEENNNYVVIISDTSSMQRGIVVKNCGDVMKLQIKVDDEGKIVDTKIKVFGCSSAISSSSYSSEIIKNKSLEEAMKVTNSEIASHLNLPPVKKHCSMLAEEAIQAAVADIKQKKKCSKHNKVPETPTGC